MSDKRYAEEFKLEAVKQITERGHSVYDVAKRLGVTTHSLYAWVKKYSQGSQHCFPFGRSAGRNQKAQS